MDFASSGYARDFFQGQVPQIIRSLKSIADSQQKLVELQMQNTSSTTACESRAASSVATVFVCYEENCAELFDEAGAVNHMFELQMQSRQFRGQSILCQGRKRIIIFRSMK